METETGRAPVQKRKRPGAWVQTARSRSGSGTFLTGKAVADERAQVPRCADWAWVEAEVAHAVADGWGHTARVVKGEKGGVLPPAEIKPRTSQGADGGPSHWAVLEFVLGNETEVRRSIPVTLTEFRI